MLGEASDELLRTLDVRSGYLSELEVGSIWGLTGDAVNESSTGASAMPK